MVNDRQKVTDDLGRLTQQLRGAARELAGTQPAASNKLRGAIQTLDENDLDTRMQRSSDGLRSGNFSDPFEAALTNDLQKLGEQVRGAARAMGAAEHGTEEASLNRAMDDLARLRDQLDNLGGRNPGQAQSASRSRANRVSPDKDKVKAKAIARVSSIRPASSTAVVSPDTRWQQNGQRPGQQNGQPGQQGQTGQQGGSQQGAAQQGGQAGGQQGNPQAGGGQVGDRLAGQAGNPGQVGNAVGGGGGGRYNGFGGVDTGNTRIGGTAAAPQRGPNPADSQRDIDQGLNLLNQVKGAVQDSPEARQELQALIDQMRNLDPSRFPGNPALIEQMHQQLVSKVDALELQLRHQLDETRGGTIRNTDPAKIPAGYQDSVAEYYRKLSGGGSR